MATNLDFSQPFLTDGGLETWLLFQQGIDLPHFSAVTLMDNAAGRAELKSYFETFLKLASENSSGFILESATWRAGRDWAEPLGYDEATLARLNSEAIGLLCELRDEWADRISNIVVSGCVGPRGDGYDPGTIMSADEAADYHSWQVSLLADAGVDMISAITMTNIPEAQGVLRASALAGIPAVISFTVETDGKLPSGDSVESAISQLDAEAALPLHYMINCAHPDHFADICRDSGDWTKRLRGLRTNASRLSHAELDEAEELDDGNPEELAALNASIAKQLPALTILGGCCGTDHRHVAQMAKARAKN